MTWKQLENRREVRLWITQIIMPAALTTAMAMNIPEVRTFVTDKIVKAKHFIENTFHAKSS